ncbi:MAG TPA: cbb3-type cytochrome c oxidase subunit I, partial [Kofleriaceae bacterium]|nr:cbb3-type cytochrome c oxidase subunit I [Kofleriaceae bacterium]
VDIWAQMVTFTETSGLLSAIVLATTVLKLRAPGMTLNRIPLFAWAMLVTSFMVMIAMPAVMFASTALILDRLVGTHFYNPSEGGDALLWQHLFWFFGHPEVYFIFIPGLGFMSSIIATFARRPVFGYGAMTLSLIATAFMAFGLWVHHMFATNLPEVGKSFFTAMSLMIAIPTAVQIFCWLATLWTGRLNLKTPLLFVLAFFVILVLGGLTGIMVAMVPLDLQLHDTYFVVAHLHYVLIGGAVFPLLGALYYWFPKITGRLMHERIGQLSAVLVFLGFNATFFPMHQLGLNGMPRRIFTYTEETGWGPLNLAATLGAFVLGIGVLLTVFNALVSMRRGKLASGSPWGGDGLEWTTSSPPPRYNFIHLPTVRDRYAAWTSRPDQPVVTGVRADRPELLVTRVMDAEPDHITELPGPAISPLLVALSTGVMFIGGIFTVWAFPLGAVLIGVSLLAWFWPKWPHREEMLAEKPSEAA